MKKLSKDTIKYINELAKVDLQRASDLLRAFNIAFDTQYDFLNRRVVFFDNPYASTAEKYAHAHDAYACAEDYERQMQILVACEESQAVTIEMRRRGHEAYSCDIQECSGGHPEWHIMGDVLPLINGRCRFQTMDGKWHVIAGKWDMLLAFPPCMYLTVAGNRWFDIERYGEKALQRHLNRKKAIAFFMAFVNADCEHIAIENPVGVMSTEYRTPDQIISPNYFGDHARKKTCLWLKGLRPLVHTNVVDPGEIRPGGYSVAAGAVCARDENGKSLKWRDPRTAKIRSKTWPGIALAMAEQWTPKY